MTCALRGVTHYQFYHNQSYYGTMTGQAERYGLVGLYHTKSY